MSIIDHVKLSCCLLVQQKHLFSFYLFGVSDILVVYISTVPNAVFCAYFEQMSLALGKMIIIRVYPVSEYIGMYQ